MRATHEVLGQLFPLPEPEVPLHESLIESWFAGTGTVAEAELAASVGGPDPVERTPWAIRAYASGRLVGACRCFDRAAKTWHRDEAEEDARLGVHYVVEAVDSIARDAQSRGRCEQILCEHLTCPALAESAIRG